MSKPCIVAVIPAFNEENTIKDTIDGLRKVNMLDEIIVIDDGSTDRTAEIVKNNGVELISLPKNYGKGYAIRKAINDIEFDFLVLVDGDLGQSAEEIEKLIYPVISGEVDFTIAKFKPQKRSGGFGLVRKLAKYGVYIYTGKRTQNSLSGQRVYSKKVIKEIQYIPNNFGVEVAMTVAAMKKGFRFLEIDVDMEHHTTGRDVKGFIHRGRQFVHISKTLLNLSFRR